MDASESYRLLECIGEGAAGPVYRAETGGGTVAVRQFRSAAPEGSPEWRGERQHFLEAGRQAVRLKHNRIVPVLEVIDEAGEAFHIMEFQPSGNLRTLLETERMAPAEADVLLRQAAIALDFAHGAGVIHGDLKPSDIFVSPQQGAKVGDFAISPRARRDRRALPANLVHGYLSPEHLRSPSAVGAQSDQYSLAAIAYEMYTGQSPYGPAASAPQSAIASAPVAPPSRINRQLPAGVDAPLLRALNRDPAQRFGSCLEFVATLDAGLISQPERSRAAGSRKLLYAGFASLAAALLALFLLWPSSKPRLAQTPVVSAPAPAPPADAKKNAPGKGKKSKAATAVAGSSTKPTPFGDLSPKMVAAVKSSQPVQAVLRAAAPPSQAPPQPAPALPPPMRTPPPAPISSSIATRGFTLGVLSRDHAIVRDSTFSLGDQTLGELGAGDLKASVQYDGGQPPRGTLTLDWAIDGLPMGIPQRVAPNQVVEYGNEPTSGAYTVTLRLNARPVQTFVFRITP